MHYLSTRGEAPVLGFTDALLAGLAGDGGLYVPESYPALTSAEVAAFAGTPYAEVAERVIAPFVAGDFAAADLRAMIAAAYREFRHPAVTPLVQLDANLFVLELFHGPTFAFKDVALQLLGRMMDRALAANGRRATIVGATSGDTGAAAIEAFRGSERADIFVLYPHGRVSDVQRRQMTTVAEDNVHAIAVEGTFDDCQSILKGLFADPDFRERMGLSGVNSINWARVVAQVVYYFVGAVALGGPGRPVSFAVPTGNFGDVLAGYVAKRMGLPVGRLLVATNANDILVRALAGGAYEIRGVQPTYSPSMDIQISSNFERLLFDAYGRDASAVRVLMGELSRTQAFGIADAPLAAIRADFDAVAVDERGTIEEMRRTYRDSGMILDPHTAIGVAGARRALAADPTTPVIALGTAHPAKFPDAVEAATGRRPPVPERLGHLLEGEERLTVLPNDRAAVAAFIRARARASLDGSAEAAA